MNDNLVTVFYIIAGILIAVGINYGLGLALGTALPIVAVESNSMVPTFARGDLLLVAGVAEADLQLDDIIVYTTERGTTPIVHRLIAKNPGGSVQTKGDANLAQRPFETEVWHDQIIGRVFLIVPFLGWVRIGFTDYVLTNPMVALLLLALIVAGWFFRRRLRGR